MNTHYFNRLQWLRVLKTPGSMAFRFASFGRGNQNLHNVSEGHEAAGHTDGCFQNLVAERRNFGRRMAHPLALAALLAAALPLALLSGCNRGGGAAADEKAKAAAAKDAGIQVVVTPAKTETISETFDVTGSLVSPDDVTVGVKANGKILNVYFREGDRVRRGDVVAEQDPVDLRNQLTQQEASRTQALANIDTARTKLTQAQAAYDNAVTNLKLTKEQTVSAVKQAQAALDAAKQQASITRQGARAQERQQAQDTLDAAKADRDKARSDLKRYQNLYRQQAISAQQLDQAQSASDSADANYSKAAAALNLIQAGNRPEDIARAQSAVEQANQTVITAQSNRNQVALRQADVENARAGIASARAGIEQTKGALAQSDAAVRLARQALKDSRILSPIDGIVQERKVEPGMQVVTAKADVMRIVSLSRLFFDSVLSESQYARVHPGMSVNVTISALPGQTFRGLVYKVFPVASAARSFTARIAMTGEGTALRPQMFATGKIALATHPNAVVVMRDAVLNQNGSDGTVMLATDGTAKKRAVKTGILSGAKLEIVSGLSVGDPVITTGQGQLQDGDKVQVLSGDKQASANP